MAKIQPSTRSFSAGSVFLPGGSVTFGQSSIIPDPENPATLKAVYLDEAQTQIAQNPQPLDSNASFQQTSDGILYGSGTYSVIWKNSAGVEVYRNLNFELLEDFGTAAFVNTGTASNEVPLNSDLGTASTRDTGTGAGQVPLGSDLLDVLRNSDVGQTVAGLSTLGATNWDSGSLSNVAPINLSAGDNADITLPSGGTYDYWGISFSASTGAISGPLASGRAAGGTVIMAAFSGRVHRAWAKQVAS